MVQQGPEAAAATAATPVTVMGRRPLPQRSKKGGVARAASGRLVGLSQSAIAQRPGSSSSPRPYTRFCHTQTAKGHFSIGKRARQRQCSGSSASEVEFSKGYRHFASVITLAQCGITAKVEASLRKRAPLRRHSIPPGRREPHWGRKPPIGVGYLPAPMLRFLPQCSPASGHCATIVVIHPDPHLAEGIRQRCVRLAPGRQ